MSEATEARESTEKTIRDQALSDLQTVLKGFMLAIQNLESTKEKHKLKINCTKRVVSVVKDTDLLGLLYSQRITRFLEDSKELLADDSTLKTTFTANQDFLGFLLCLYKVSKYPKLSADKKAFFKSKLRSLDKSYRDSELFRNNFDSLILIYSLALEEENFDFERINAKIGDLLLIANICGAGTPKSKINDNLKSALKAILAGQDDIDFETYYQTTPRVPVCGIEAEGILKKYLFIKLLAHNPKKDWRRALEAVKQYLGEEGIQSLTQKDLKCFLQFKSSDSNQKLIRKRPSDERINKVFDEFRLA